MENAIYLSPHLDDAVLSCGGQIALQTRDGQPVQVVTVFAGDVVGPLSPFALELHQRWKLGVDGPAARRAEDRAALALIGATGIYWDLPECIYRRDLAGTVLYPDEAALWGPLHSGDGPLVAELARRIAALPVCGPFCIPLGAGGHVDHRLVRQAAESTGRPLVYYEEYPYAENFAAVEKVLTGNEWESRRVYLDEKALQVKVAAVTCYYSQQSTFWADEAEMVAQFRAYGLRVGEGRLAERCWVRR